MLGPQTLADEATRIAVLQPEADAGSRRAQSEVDQRRADLKADALDAIGAVLSGQHHTRDTPESIAAILRDIDMPVDVGQPDDSTSPSSWS